MIGLLIAMDAADVVSTVAVCLGAGLFVGIVVGLNVGFAWGATAREEGDESTAAEADR